MKISADTLITDLTNRTQLCLSKAAAFNELSAETLNFKRDELSWSALECLEHLNLYGRFYLPEIAKRIQRAESKNKESFKSGWLGNYFANSMLPKEKLNKMKTFKNMNPLNSRLDKEKVIREFMQQQEEILRLLNQARKIDLNKTKTNISISKWIKLKLGDTFRFVIFHNQRHLVQAEKVLKGMEN
ncbi:DinB family protein [Fluviicola sp.]|uniref:DinB family protein n=1 Tax=Fluviicola sp. TaxID=1917219 RepID=UPI00261158F8|nr:DinB family protein [Fluviicola sp.]